MVMKEKISEYVDIKRIEFVVTYQCGGKCKHCQMGSRINKGGTHRHVLVEYAMEAIEKLATVFDIASVMTFGGEPLYYPDVVAAIHKKATDCGIETRQVITNGYFTDSAKKSGIVANALADAGVNDLLLSVDAFHQEHIPLEPVWQFACDAITAKIPGFRLHPAWLVNEKHQNPYNSKTRELLERFSGLSIPVGKGNNIWLQGNTIEFLREYYDDAVLNFSENGAPEPCLYPLEIKNISIDPNGDIGGCGFAIGNIYQEDALDIIARYDPHKNEAMLAQINGGVSGLLAFAKKQGIVVSPSDYFDECVLCQAIASQLKNNKYQKIYNIQGEK